MVQNIAIWMTKLINKEHSPRKENLEIETINYNTFQIMIMYGSVRQDIKRTPRTYKKRQVGHTAG